MIAYKLVRLKKNGAITPLFINKTFELPLEVWLDSEDHPTPGYAHRPGWHCTAEMAAPHLSKKGRVWVQVEISDYVECKRPESQGGLWYLAKRMKIINVINHLV